MKKRVLFIDRDGTIIVEPPIDYQIDSLQKLEFIPRVVTGLSSIVPLGFELVLATNQDGLGTPSFPEETFHPPHNKMIELLANEGITFSDQIIDRTFESDNKPTRKPGVALFGKYLAKGEYDLANSFVIGDRLTDIMLAKNLGAKGILLLPEAKGQEALKEAKLEEYCALVTDNWHTIAEFLRTQERTATITRNTSETKISLSIDLDGKGESKVDTGLNFLNHMLEQIVHHAGVTLRVEVEGDLEVDEHHTIEDCAIVLGEAVGMALGSKRGIERYGYALPMDESSAMVLLDFGGRIELVWDAEFRREMVGDVPTEMFRHFFKSFADGAKCNLHISAKGTNDHHKIEGIFKAFARAMRMAIKRNVFSYELPSSKGVL